jgi:hypothetical protein
MATTGAASIPMPNPIEACMHDATRIAIAMTAYAVTLTDRVHLRYPARHALRVSADRSSSSGWWHSAA